MRLAESHGVAREDFLKNYQGSELNLKRSPTLRRGPRAAAHIPSDRRMSDLEAKLEQFTMNVWRAPDCGYAGDMRRRKRQPSRSNLPFPFRRRDVGPYSEEVR